MSQQGVKLSTSIAATTAGNAVLQQQIDRLDAAMASIRADAATADKRAEYSLSLYGKITNITWDYDANSTGALSGCKFPALLLTVVSSFAFAFAFAFVFLFCP